MLTTFATLIIAFATASGFETRDRVRVDARSIFVDGSRMCDIDRILQRIPRPSVTEVKGSREVHASKAAVVGGAVAGEVVGLLLVVSTLECRIPESIRGCQLQLWAPLWAPFAGGTLGYPRDETRQRDDLLPRD